MHVCAVSLFIQVCQSFVDSLQQRSGVMVRRLPEVWEGEGKDSLIRDRGKKGAVSGAQMHMVTDPQKEM